MASLNFKLRMRSEPSASIVLFFQYGKGNRLRYSTGLKVINVKNWNNEKQRIKNVVQEVNKLPINAKLDELQSFLNKKYTSLYNDYGNVLSNDILIKELNVFFGKEKKSELSEVKFLELLPFFKWYLEHYRTNPIPTTKKPLGSGTIKTYNNAYNKLKLFNDEVYSLNYKNITLDFYDDYLKYLQSHNLSSNYIGTLIKILKTIMNMSYEKGFHENLDFKKRYFVKHVEKVPNVYLTENELLKIYNLNLTELTNQRVSANVILSMEQLDTARDLFLIGANTGLRVSDFSALNERAFIEIKGKKYFNLNVKKTDEPITIPISPMVKKILDKRNGTPPKSMPNQHINYAMKFLCRLAKINSKESKSITKGGLKQNWTMEKWKLVTSHTARRSFCTNAYKSGMPTIDIMAISGHKTERVFYNYIKVSPEERAVKIGMHEFFNNNNLKIV